MRARFFGKGKCLICEQFSPLVRHHVVPRSKGGSNDSDNILMVCLLCHKDLTRIQPLMEKRSKERKPWHGKFLNIKEYCELVEQYADTYTVNGVKVWVVPPFYTTIHDTENKGEMYLNIPKSFNSEFID